MTKEKFFLFSLLFFIFGIFSFFVSREVFYFSFFFFPFLIFLFRKRIFVVSFLIFAFSLGGWWAMRAEKNHLNIKRETLFFTKKEKVLILGKIEKILTSFPRRKIILKIEKINGKTQKEIRAFLNLPSFYFLKEGEKIIAEGKLVFLEDNKNNLIYFYKTRKIFFNLENPKVKKILRENRKTFFENFKESLKEKTKLLFPPEKFLLEAIVLGERKNIPFSFKEKLSRTGLYHIIAISGMHIMVLFEIFISFFIFLGLWRREATILSSFLIIFYLFLIDFPPSALRATFMGSFLYLGKAFGRKSFSFRSLLISAFFILLFNPFFIGDLSFLLSFLSALGIVSFYPILLAFFKAQNSYFKRMIILTFSAQLLPFPLVIFAFKKFSFLSFISNLFVLPFLPYILASGILFLFLTSFLNFLSPLFAFVFRLPFSFLSVLINILDKLSFLKISSLPNFFFFPFYFLILAFLFYLSKRYEKEVL